MLFYVESRRGAALVEADSADIVEEYMLEEYGREGAATEIRAATARDERHVRGFGGKVHPLNRRQKGVCA